MWQVRAKLGTEAKLGVGEVTEALAALEATQEHIKSHKDAEAQKVGEVKFGMPRLGAKAWPGGTGARY